jgi:hypothetical protein
MEKIVNKEMVNGLLEKLGHKNISISETPIFHWNGNCVTSDESAPVKQVGSLSLNNIDFMDFIKSNDNNKIVFVGYPDGKLINDKNEIRVFIDSK